MNNSLSSQAVVPAPPGVKIRLAIMSLATVDALGSPVEFHARGTFEPVTSMKPNNNFWTPPGTWTDDTSMALCLAHSLSTSGSPNPQKGMEKKGGFSELHQLSTYSAWYTKGFLSCTGQCFDIGNTIRNALDIWHKSTTKAEGLENIQKRLAREIFRGNGSLMRVLPIGLAYWSLGEAKAADFARRSSLTTHPDSMCQEACEIYTRLVVAIMSHSTSETAFTKLDLLQQLSRLPIQDRLLRESLCIPDPPADCSSIEQYYVSTHPLLKIAARFPPTLDKNGIPGIPPDSELRSSGYVLHTLIAALYAFFVTENFHTGALLAVNMGDDADTVGAVYGGIAGAWYSSLEGGYWFELTRNWVDNLQGQSMLEETIAEFIEYEEKVRKQGSDTDVS